LLLSSLLHDAKPNSAIAIIPAVFKIDFLIVLIFFRICVTKLYGQYLASNTLNRVYFSTWFQVFFNQKFKNLTEDVV